MGFSSHLRLAYNPTQNLAIYCLLQLYVSLQDQLQVVTKSDDCKLGALLKGIVGLLERGLDVDIREV